MRVCVTSLLLLTAVVPVQAVLDTAAWLEPLEPPEPEPLYAEVVVDALNLRDAPSLDGNKIDLLQGGDRVEILAWAVAVDDYLWVEVLADSGRGYLAARREGYQEPESGEWVPAEPYLSYVWESGYDIPHQRVFTREEDGVDETVTVRFGELRIEMNEHMGTVYYEYSLPVELIFEMPHRPYEQTIELGEFLVASLPERTDPGELEPVGDHGWFALHDIAARRVRDGDDSNVIIGICYELQEWTEEHGTGFVNERVWWWFEPWEEVYETTFTYIDHSASSIPYGRGTQYWSHDLEIKEVWGENGVTLRGTVVVSPAHWDPVVFGTNPVMVGEADAGRWNRVRRILTPPDQLEGCCWYGFEVDFIYDFSGGLFLLYCPPGNRYGEMNDLPHLRRLQDIFTSRSVTGTMETGWEIAAVGHPLELTTLPGADTVVDVVPAGEEFDYLAYHGFKALVDHDGTLGWASTHEWE